MIQRMIGAHRVGADDLSYFSQQRQHLPGVDATDGQVGHPRCNVSVGQFGLEAQRFCHLSKDADALRFHIALLEGPHPPLSRVLSAPAAAR